MGTYEPPPAGNPSVSTSLANRFWSSLPNDCFSPHPYGHTPPLTAKDEASQTAQSKQLVPMYKPSVLPPSPVDQYVFASLVKAM